MTGAPDIWVLQHPSERGHSKGTLRVAEACIRELQVLVGEQESDFVALRKHADLEHTALLFPTGKSAPVESPMPALPRSWIIIDGSWRKAKRILLSNPWLSLLPHYHFQNPPVSRYAVRRSTQEGGLSTLEAIDYLLSLTTPETDTVPLKEGFDALLEAHLSQLPRPVRKRYE